MLRVEAMPTFVETYRTTVSQVDCDHLGHMKVQHYFAAVSEGMFAIMVRLGLDRETIHRRQRLRWSMRRLTFTASCGQEIS